MAIELFETKKINFNDLIGKPFKYGGRGPGSYDCYGLCIEAAKRAGIFLPEIKELINLRKRNEKFVVEKNKCYKRILKPEPFCFITLKLHPKYITHIGFCIDHHRFLHITKEKRTCIEKLITYKRKIEGYYKFIND